MIKTPFILILFLALLAIPNMGFVLSNEIKVQFIGNCGLYLTDGTTNIYSDFPYKSGAYNYMEFDEAQLDSVKKNSIFIFTHKHADHYSRKNMKKVLKEKGGKKYGWWNIKKLENLSKTIPDFSVKAYKTKHRFSLQHYSYLITWHGKKIFLSGDTESAETIAKIKDMDIAFIPYWLVVDANQKDIKIDTEIRAIYHLYPGQKISGDIPEDVKLLNTQGDVIHIPY